MMCVDNAVLGLDSGYSAVQKPCTNGAAQIANPSLLSDRREIVGSIHTKLNSKTNISYRYDNIEFSTRPLLEDMKPMATTMAKLAMSNTMLLRKVELEDRTRGVIHPNLLYEVKV